MTQARDDVNSKNGLLSSPTTTPTTTTTKVNDRDAASDTAFASNVTPRLTSRDWEPVHPPQASHQSDDRGAPTQRPPPDPNNKDSKKGILHAQPASTSTAAGDGHDTVKPFLPSTSYHQPLPESAMELRRAPDHLQQQRHAQNVGMHPALPDELIAVLSLDPSEREEMQRHIQGHSAASPSQPAVATPHAGRTPHQLPALSATSPFAVNAEHLFTGSSNRSTPSTHVSDSSGARAASSRSGLGLESGYLDELAQQEQQQSAAMTYPHRMPDSHPLLSPDTPRPNVRPQSDKFEGRTLRKTNSAESLPRKYETNSYIYTTHHQAGQQPGLGGGGKYAGPINGRAQQSENDIKRIWKNLSSRLGKGNDRDTGSTSASTRWPSQPTRNPSSDASSRPPRHSMSVYGSPGGGSERPASMVSGTSGSSLAPASGTPGPFIAGSFGAMERQPLAYAEDDDLAWPARETFVQDLSQRKRKPKGGKPSMADLNKGKSPAASMPLASGLLEDDDAEQGVDSEDDDDDDDDEDKNTSEIASQLSYVDPSGYGKPAICASQASLTAADPDPHEPASLPLGAPSSTEPLPTTSMQAPPTPQSAAAATPSTPLPLPSKAIRPNRPRSYSESAVRPLLPSTPDNEDGLAIVDTKEPVKLGLPPAGRRRRTSSTNLLKELTDPRVSTADFVVALVGPKKVGKSTIITSNLKLSKDTATVLYQDEEDNRVVSYVGQFSVIGRLRTIEILEVDMDILSNSDEGLAWPANLPKLDSALICYKQGDPKALETLGTLLKGFWIRGGIALIALATHCKPASTNEPRPERDEAARICNMYGAGLVHLDGGLQDPQRKAKNSLQWVLKKVIDKRESSERSSPTSKKRTKTGAIPSLSKQKSTATLLAGDIKQNAIPSNLGSLPMTPSDSFASSTNQSAYSGMGGLKEGNESVDAIDEDAPSKFSQLDIYLSKDDLIQKFLFAAVTGNDEQHVGVFLIVYRRFARPYDVLNALVERFAFSTWHSNSDFLLSRYVQMKLCKVLTIWLERHPGDFGARPTLNLLKTFLDQLYASNWVQHYAMELEPMVDAVQSVPDIDAIWAMPDNQEEDDPHAALNSVLPERRPSLVSSLLSDGASSHVSTGASASYLSSTPVTPTFASTHTSNYSSTMGGPPSKSTSSIPGIGTGNRSRSYSDTGTNASSDQAPSVNSTQSLATRQTGRRHVLLLEVSNAILQCNPDRVAEQITKTAWDIFSEMQPRDLLRHILVPRDPDNPGAIPSRNPDDPVTKSIEFGNYLSNWVATMILAQSKQKYRIRLIEQFIRVAIGLRELDNFDCLMAVLLGLNSQPVHRLNEMADFLDKELYKKFRSLNRLMATSRSFAAYRLAILNARPEMIPYLGIHLQDITRLHDGKSDMRNGLVNWTKMRQIGKHCAIVNDCARLAPYYADNPYVARLITGLPVYSLDTDDILYDLSFLYKPRGGAQPVSSTSKFKKLLRDTLNPNSAS